MPHRLPGTWSLSAKHPDGTDSHPIIVFTEHGSIVERVISLDQAALGVWRWDNADDRDGFQFMWIRYVPLSPPGAIDPPAGTMALRMRASNQFTGPHAFKGTACIDALDQDLNVLQLGWRQATHTAVPMDLLPWRPDCGADPLS